MSALIVKQEPLTPFSYEEGSQDDLFYETSLDQYDIKLDDPFECESKAEIASQILENLEKLVDLDQLIKEEHFLLDEKILPMLEDVEAPRAVPVPAQCVKMEYLKAPDTQSLLQEFETVYDVVELTHGTLTPPQSPPQPVLATLEPLNQVPEKNEYRGFLPLGIDFPSVNTPQPDIAHELAVVDELVRTRVEDMQWSSGPSSPSCSNSSFTDCSSDDPEWTPDPQAFQGEPEPKQQRKRSKPYSRGSSDDKKSRKKEQNKNAATRYRLKKKAEVEEILSEEKQLLNQNGELGGKITELQREIKYLKGLMRDLFKAKGLIN